MPGPESGSIPDNFVVNFGVENVRLNLEGVQCGRVGLVTGGNATADVISEPPGPDHTVKKHLAGVKYEDIVMSFRMQDLATVVYDWIAATLKGTFQRKNGSIIVATHEGKVLRTLEFTNALITEVDIPAMDAHSGPLPYMTVKLTPELTRFSQGGKVSIAGIEGWVSAFRLRIDGLDCQQVNHIDPFPITLTSGSANVGELRDFEKEPLQLHVPNLK